jgi:hypothetical protein
VRRASKERITKSAGWSIPQVQFVSFDKQLPPDFDFAPADVKRHNLIDSVEKLSLAVIAQS